MRTTFSGWPQEALDWFEGLEQDNSKAYVAATRGTYEAAVRGPLLALLEAVEAEFGAGKVFRPNRDVRFSADKSPYKTHTAAIVGGHHAGYYVEVSADGLVAGGGYHGMTRDQLERFRAAVGDDHLGEGLEAHLRAAAARGLEPFGEALKTAPRGYPTDHSRIELLRRKGLALVRRDPPGGVLHHPEALDWVVETWRALRPVLGWLDAHVGPPADA
jgi:uncharacterized protein (TIGR02453 family)